MRLIFILFISQSTVCSLSKNHFQPNFKSVYLRGTKLFSLSTSDRGLVSIDDELDSYIRKGPVTMAERCFLINGWRWHTASLLRDLRRFSCKAKEEEKQGNSGFIGRDSLLKCYEFVCDFSFNGLCRIEREIFFPWMDRILPTFSLRYLSDVKQTQESARTISNDLRMLCTKRVTDLDHSILAQIIDKVDQLESCVLSMQSIQTKVFIPVISAYVSKGEQMRFNRRVIMCLGPLEAQIHLVGMAETIRGLPEEEKLLRSQIPTIAQAMLPLWKRQFYLPKAKCLELGTNQ